MSVEEEGVNSFSSLLQREGKYKLLADHPTGESKRGQLACS